MSRWIKATEREVYRQRELSSGAMVLDLWDDRDERWIELSWAGIRDVQADVSNPFYEWVLCPGLRVPEGEP